MATPLMRALLLVPKVAGLERVTLIIIGIAVEPLKVAVNPKPQTFTMA